MTQRKTAALFALVVGFGAALLWGSLTDGHNWGDDFAQYVMQARSLVEASPREFVAANRAMIAQSSFAFAPAAYPWGFPVLLAPVYAMFGLDMIALKAVGALCAALFLVALWPAFRRSHSAFGFLALACLFAFNPNFIVVANSILSDAPYLLVSTLAIAAIGALAIDRRRLISPSWDYALLGCVIAVAFFVRTVGVLLLPALAVAQLAGAAQPRARDAEADRRLAPASTTRVAAAKIAAGPRFVQLVPYGVFLGLVIAWQLAFPGGGDGYLPELAKISPATIAKHLYYYGVDAPAEFFRGVPGMHALYWASVPLAIAGAVRRRRSDAHALAYVALMLGVTIVWPDYQGYRFLLPVLPFYVSFVLSGLAALADAGSAAQLRMRRLACAVPVVLVIVVLGWHSAHGVAENLGRHRATLGGPFTGASKAMFAFIGGQTAKDATVIFFKPRAMTMMTNRRAVLITRADEVARADYLCVFLGGDAWGQLPDAAVESLRQAGTATLAFENGDFRVYRLQRLP